MAPLINKKNDTPFYIWTAVAGIGGTLGASLVDGRFNYDFLIMCAIGWVINITLSWVAKVRKWK